LIIERGFRTALPTVSVVGWAERLAGKCYDLLVRRVGSASVGGLGAVQVSALSEQQPEVVGAGGVSAFVGASVGGLGVV